MRTACANCSGVAAAPRSTGLRALAGATASTSAACDAGARIVLPVLQHVVAADVGLVANRNELRDADPPLVGLTQEFDADPSRLREKGDVARRRHYRRERRVQAHRRIGVRDAETVRP